MNNYDSNICHNISTPPNTLYVAYLGWGKEEVGTIN